MTQDLTVGKPLLRVWQFAVPVLFGLLLQQVYSLVDTAIVGHALGVMALGGVGATGSVNFLVLGFCGGLCTGMAIPLAQSFGAGEYHQLRRYVAGCVWLGIAMSALLLALTLPTTWALLKLMGTPEEQMGYAYDYIFIIFIGIPATILYNMGACVLRSLGDSKSPVWFLAIASVINIVLDLLTVCVLGMGVAGAAIATVISQLASCVIGFWYMYRKYELLRVSARELRLEPAVAGRILRVGLPMALQQSIVSCGFLFLQKLVNLFGESMIASYTVASRMENILMIPIIGIQNTMATYAGQNMGARQPERVSRGLGQGVLVSLLTFFLYKRVEKLFFRKKRTA